MLNRKSVFLWLMIVWFFSPATMKIAWGNNSVQNRDDCIVARWKMDEGFGNMLIDSSGNELNATLNNISSSSWVDGVFGNAINFDGNNQDAEIASPGELGSLSSLTITSYIKIGSDVGWAWITTHGDNYGLYITDDGFVRFYFYDGGDWPGVNGHIHVGDNLWHHIAATFDHTTGIISIYIDGELDNSQQVSGTIHYSIGSQFTIASMMGDRYLKGTLDDLRVYNEPLSQEEIINIMNDNNSGAPPRLSNGKPTGYLPLGTTSVRLSLETNVQATCKYDTLPNLSYDEMSFTFSTTDGLLHTDSIHGLQDFSSYTYYCKSKDTSGNENSLDYIITFKVDSVLPIGYSYIPLFVIETEGGAPIVDEPKVTANLRVIDNGPGEINSINDPGNDYDGYIGIEIRGHFSAELPQKPYGFETRDAAGENNNVSLLGMPEENDWILLANYNDKAFVRNALAFDIFRKMGHYAPRTAFCEVYVNGVYGGIYVLTEKIKRDKHRVNIEKLKKSDNSGDQVTGGYIIKNDYYEGSNDSWQSNYPPFIGPSYAKVYFVYHYPKAKDITAEQKQYIKSFIDDFESLMHSDDFNDPEAGFNKYIDALSFVDYFLISELSRNVDGYKKSRYFYKDIASKDNRLHSGPNWDYDWAWKNIDDCEVFSRTNGSGWGYEAGNNCNQDYKPPVYIARLLQDSSFRNMVRTRYDSLRKTILSEEYLFSYIDSSANYLYNAQQRHYSKWDILGKNVGSPEVDAIPDTFEGEIEKMKQWITTRLVWLDENMPGKATDPSSVFEKNQYVYHVFPNPATDKLFIESEEMLSSVAVYNLSGMVVYQKATSVFAVVLDVQSFAPGLYMLKISTASGKVKTEKIVVK